jgi:hypothetical protein
MRWFNWQHCHLTVLWQALALELYGDVYDTNLAREKLSVGR